MDFRLDFAKIDLLELRTINISTNEVKSIFLNENSIVKEYTNFTFLLGFSSERKFIRVAFQISKNSNFDIEVLQIDLPYEEDVKEYWCAKR
jgi:hypothetical protein